MLLPNQNQFHLKPFVHQQARLLFSIAIFFTKVAPCNRAWKEREFGEEVYSEGNQTPVATHGAHALGGDIKSILPRLPLAATAEEALVVDLELHDKL